LKTSETPLNLAHFFNPQKLSEVLSYDDNRLIFYQKGANSQLTKIMFQQRPRKSALLHLKLGLSGISKFLITCQYPTQKIIL